jgi:hypothetical protein
MKTTKKMERLLGRMARIKRMERGKLCPMGGGSHYNHQTWQEGRNVVRYVPAKEAALLQEGIDGYHQFMTLVEQYADEVIKQTRREREALFPKPGKTAKTRQPQSPQKDKNKKIDS